MKVVFLFNFSPEVGGGHFKRCSNLALKFLENNAKVFFITNEHNVLKSFASKKKIKIFTKKKNKSNEFNIDQNVKILKKIKKIDLLIIDDYEINFKVEKKLSNYVKKILIIDDFKNKKHFCDYYLNASPTIKNQKIKPTKRNCINFLGLDYLILDENYKKNFLEKKKNEIKNILIFVSFTNHKNIIERLLKIFNKKKFNKFNFFIVLGTEYKYNKNLTYLRNTKNFKFFKRLNSLFNVLKNINIAIGSGGINLWERFYMLIPSIVFKLSKNQTENVRFLEEKKCIVKSNSFDENKFSNLFAHIVKNKARYFSNIENNRYLVDGYGSDRIIFNLIKPPFNKLKLSKVKLKDINFLYKLANDKINRDYSFNPKLIKFQEHKKWFTNKFKSKYVNIFILKFKKLRLGQIRLERKKNFIEIDYSIDKPFRNFGLGTYIVKKALYKISRSSFFRNKVIIARVNKNNLASVSIFKKLNFKEKKLNQNFVEFYLKY